jgi:hypothetical protein
MANHYGLRRRRVPVLAAAAAVVVALSFLAVSAARAAATEGESIDQIYCYANGTPGSDQSRYEVAIDIRWYLQGNGKIAFAIPDGKEYVLITGDRMLQGWDNQRQSYAATGPDESISWKSFDSAHPNAPLRFLDAGSHDNASALCTILTPGYTHGAFGGNG